MSHHRYGGAASFAAFALIAAVACGGDGDTAPGGARAQNDPRPGMLVIGLSDDPAHLNPGITTQGGVHAASRMLYSGLVGLDEDQRPIPELARSWEVLGDGRLYRFHLRDDVLWHDGRRFTSADVKFSFDEILLKYHARARASLGTVLDSISVPDSLTAEFHFREPYAPLLQQLNVHEAVMLPRHVYEGTDPPTNPANLAPVGTGPFRFVSHEPDVEIRYEANPDYFKPGLPRLDRIVMRVVPDGGTQVLALEAGEIDWLYGAPPPEHERLQQEGFVLIPSAINAGGANCIMTLSFNLDRPLWQDRGMRRALAHGIDRAQVLERVNFGQGRIADAPISSQITFAHAAGLPMPQHDSARAAELFRAGGIDPRSRRRVEFLHFPSFIPYAELLRAQLAPFGLDLVSRPLEPASFVEAVFVRRDFDLNLISYCNMTDPEIGVRRMYVTSNIAPVPFSNASGYRNPVVDSLFDEGRTRVGLDARGEAYRRIQEILVEDLPYFWLVESVTTWVHSPRCEGFQRFGHFAETATCGTTDGGG
ncbi:MAG: ABC transporter substrate-binding protein [Gemmatimonadota bacterium]|jgi:peptide/nickel transport system substrate-binding protein